MPNDDLDINKLLAGIPQGQSTAAAPTGSALDAFSANLDSLAGGIVGSSTAQGKDPWPNSVQGYWGLDVIDEPVQHLDPYVARHLGEYPEHEAAYPRGYLPTKKPIQSVLASLAQLSTRERTMRQNRLHRAGYLGNDYRVGALDDKTAEGFSTLLNETARQALAGGEEMSWQDYLAERITAAEDEENKKETSTTSSVVRVTSQESGRGYIWDAFKAAIGRDPSESEIDKFMAQLNAAERANPTVTTRTYDAQGGYQDYTSGGFDENAQSDLARQYLMSNPNYAENEAISKYFPILTQALEKSTDLEGGL